MAANGNLMLPDGYAAIIESRDGELARDIFNDFTRFLFEQGTPSSWTALDHRNAMWASSRQHFRLLEMVLPPRTEEYIIAITNAVLANNMDAAINVYIASDRVVCGHAESLCDWHVDYVADHDDRKYILETHARRTRLQVLARTQWTRFWHNVPSVNPTHLDAADAALVHECVVDRVQNICIPRTPGDRTNTMKRRIQALDGELFWAMMRDSFHRVATSTVTLDLRNPIQAQLVSCSALRAYHDMDSFTNASIGAMKTLVDRLRI